MRTNLTSAVFTALTIFLPAALASVLSRPPRTAILYEPDPALKVSEDGSCGNGQTCLGSKWGTCCSAHGYCGSTSDYCGNTCKPAFGTCNLAPVSAQGVSSDLGSAACKTTATETQTHFETSYQAVRTTYTATETATSTSTVLVTKSTLLYDISFTTNVVTVTATVATLVPQLSQAAPSPTFPGTADNCKEWYKIRNDVRCSQVTDVFGISKDDLREWNPAMSRSEEGEQEKDRCTVGALDQLKKGTCRVPCKELWPGYHLCVGV